MVARRTRLELATSGVTGRCSNQLNYRRAGVVSYTTAALRAISPALALAPLPWHGQVQPGRRRSDWTRVHPYFQHPRRCCGDDDALTRGLAALSSPDLSVEDLCEVLAGSSRLEAARQIVEAQVGMPPGSLRRSDKAVLVVGPWAVLRALALLGIARESDREARLAVAIGCRELGRQLGLPGLPELDLACLLRRKPSRLCRSTFDALVAAARRLAAVHEVRGAYRLATEFKLPLCRVHQIRQIMRSEVGATLAQLDRDLAS